MTKRPHDKKEEDPTLADLAGSGFALLQHGIDRVIERGFSAMKKVNESTPVESVKHPAMRAAAKGGKALMRFLGNASETYYKTYEELKRKTK